MTRPFVSNDETVRFELQERWLQNARPLASNYEAIRLNCESVTIELRRHLFNAPDNSGRIAKKGGERVASGMPQNVALSLQNALSDTPFFL